MRVAHQVGVETSQHDRGEGVELQHPARDDLARGLEGQQRNRQQVQPRELSGGDVDGLGGLLGFLGRRAGAVADDAEGDENRGDDDQEGLEGEGDEEGRAAEWLGEAVECGEGEGAEAEGDDCG